MNIFWTNLHKNRGIFYVLKIWVAHEHTRRIGAPGGYSTLVWVGVCRWDFWNATHPCTHFEGKVTHPCTKNQNFSLKFAPFWRKFRKILKSWPIKVPNLRNFGANFRKFWKIDPSKYHVFEKKRAPLMYLAAWFCYPCLRHIPITTFVLSTPPRDRGYEAFMITRNRYVFRNQ